MRRKVFFRADGNTEIGLGHLVRSSALASMISDDFETTFLTREENELFVRNMLKSSGAELKLIPTHLPIIDEPEYLMKQFVNREDILVLDGYKFDSAYQKIIKQNGSQLICIDDLHTEYFFADIVINHAIGITAASYKSEFYTRLLLGPAFALLREPFLSCEPILRNFEGKLSALICFGGSDLNNYTVPTIERLLSEKSIGTIHVVTGKAFPFVDKLNEIVANRGDDRVQLHNDISADEMKEIMIVSDIAVCSASSVSIEYMSVGGGLFLVQTVDNQKEIFKNALELKVAFDFQDFNIKKDFKEICANQRLYFGGDIKARYKKAFHQADLESMVYGRKVKEGDVMQIFQWANDPQNRANSYSSNPIEWNSHIRWFENKLSDQNCFFYIFYKIEKAVGTVRFDFSENEYVVAFSVDSEYRGTGLGKIILKKAILELKSVKSGIISAHVKKTNLPSAKIFESLRFKLADSDQYQNSYKYTLEF